MSRSPRRRENPFCTLRRVVKTAKDEGRVNSRECDDINTAVNKIDYKIGELQTENSSLRRKNEQLSICVEVADHSVRVKDQAEGARENVVTQVIAEKEKWKAKCMRLTSLPTAQDQCTVQDIEKTDPFLALLGAYIQDQSNKCGIAEKPTESQNDIITRQQSGDRRQGLGHHSSCHRRQGTRAVQSSPGENYRFEDPETKILLEECTNTVHSRRKRTYSDVNYQVMSNAGVTAQRRRRSGSRYQRSLSSSSIPLRRNSQRNSLGLDNFLSVFNDNTVTNGELSKLSWLILHVLTEARRPVEVTTLKRLLTNSTTCAQTECFLRYSVVSHLVAQLQSPNSASVFVNVCPFLIESSSQFIEDLNKQHPVNKRPYTASF